MDFIPYLFFINVIFFALAILCFICLHMLWNRHIGANAKLVFLRKKVDGIPSEQEWRDSVTDKKLEEELEEYILNPERRGELLDEIRSANVKIPGITNSENIPLLSSEVGSDSSNLSDEEKRIIAADNRRQVLRVLMALRGKLLLKDVENGVEFKRRDTDIYSMKPSDFAKQAEDNANFMLWIQRQLESQGVKSSLCVKSGENDYLVAENKRFFGKYVWLAEQMNEEKEEIESIVKTERQAFLDKSLFHRIIWFLFRLFGLAYLGTLFIFLLAVVFG